MDTHQADSSEHDQRLDEVVADYLNAAATGSPPDRELVLARHPDLAPELTKFLDDHDQINGCMERVRQVAADDGWDCQGRDV